MTAVTAPSALKLEIRRVFATEPAVLFEAWVNPEVIKQWFGPPNRTIKSVEVDPRLGGSYRIELEGAPEEPVVSVTGVYTAFEPDELLAFTWHGDWSPGEESRVVLSFQPVEGGTEQLLTHEHFMSEESLEGHRKGWTFGLNSLATLLR